MTTTPRLWNSLTQVNTTDGDKNQFQSQITPLQDGGYVVVWTDLSRTDNPLGEAVVGQRYNAAGNKVGGEVMLSQFTSGDQFSPAITTWQRDGSCSTTSNQAPGTTTVLRPVRSGRRRSSTAVSLAARGPVPAVAPVQTLSNITAGVRQFPPERPDSSRLRALGATSEKRGFVT